MLAWCGHGVADLPVRCSSGEDMMPERKKTTTCDGFVCRPVAWRVKLLRWWMNQNAKVSRGNLLRKNDADVAQGEKGKRGGGSWLGCGGGRTSAHDTEEEGGGGLVRYGGERRS
jgi:hypothetical protein